MGTALFIPIQVRNLLGDDQNFKMVWGCKKEEDQISMSFFLLHQLKLMSHFVPVTFVSPDTTLKERCLE